ncbi:MAG: 3'-5' exonuclease [Candidatus Promineofilum sp.]|nr:3'-5' exonuclease [Promineifilum sp.]
MIRSVPAHVWAFDLEWAPDLASGRRAYNLPLNAPDGDVYAAMWAAGGATADEPRPYLKTMLCRIVSMAVVIRKADPDDRVSLTLFSLPTGGAMAEHDLISRFLRGIGETNPKPQLVGFNSREADLPILIQRGIAQGVSAPGFSRRPDKPWDGYDYFSKNSDGHVDLKEVIGGWGKATPKLHEFAAACGIPGKIDTSGDNVIDLWLAGDVRAIVEYNEFDALTTYLLWLRTAHFAGHFSDAAHAAEVERVRDLLRKRIADGQAHLARYAAKWQAMGEGG